jgi:CheY-like chemotaxis protein
MTDVSKLLEGLAAVAWPAIIILLIFLFRPAISALIESAKSRKFTLKFGGQELSMEEANEQQRTLIADLQTQVLEIKKRIEVSVLPLPPEATRSAAPTSARFVLWVDDNPKNNSFFVQQLTDRGINVDLALSTSEGLRLFGKKAYGAVISDMGRTEDGKYNPTAGIELLRQIREGNKTLPFIIFCTSRGVTEHRQEAMSLRATGITSSGTEMSGILQAVFQEEA